MIKRPRQIDFFRPLTRINTWEEFNSFDNDGTSQGTNIPASQSENNQQTAASTDPTAAGAGHEKSDASLKKVEIPIILASNIKPAGTQSTSTNGKSIGDEITKKRKLMQSNYVRFKSEDVWPKQEKYELADDDIFFLKDFNETHGFSMKEAELETLIETFELKSGRDFIVTWIDIKDKISFDMRDKYTFNNIEKIYNYWRVKRDTVKRPLLRLHWKPNFNDKDPHVAFRPRVADKMKTRSRQNKPNDDEQYNKLSVLCEEMNKSKLLIEQMRLREDMKEWQYEMMSLQFVTEIYKTDKTLSYMFADEYFESAKDVDQKRIKLEERFTIIMRKSDSLRQELGRFIEQPVEITQQVEKLPGSKQISRLEGQKKTQLLGNTGGVHRDENSNTTGLNHRATGNNNSNQLKRIMEESLLAGNSNNLTNSTNNQSAIGTGNSQNGELDIEKNGQKKLSKQERKEKKLQLKSQKHMDKLQNASSQAESSNVELMKEDNKKEQSLAQAQQGTAENKTQKELISINLKNPNNSTNISNKNAEGGNTTATATSNSNTNRTQEKDANGNLLVGSSDKDLVSYLVWLLIEGGKRELSLDKVLNINNNQIDSETAQTAYAHNAHLLKLNSLRKQLPQQSGLNGAASNAGQIGQSQSQQLFQQSSQQQQQQLLLQQQQSGNQQGMPYSQQNQQYSSSMQNGRIMQQSSNQSALMQQQQHLYGQIPNSLQSQSSYQLQQQQQQELGAHQSAQQQQQSLAKKKNIIIFKTRLRIGRSGLCNIDRLFDEKDNLRYEDLCSKEANYNPSKIAEKLILQETDQDRQAQNKLKVLSYSSNTMDLYKKDYFQAISQKYKKLAEDMNNLSEETTEPLTPLASSEDLPVNQNAIDIENKNLKKIISVGLKEFQKRKQMMGIAGGQGMFGLQQSSSMQSAGGIRFSSNQHIAPTTPQQQQTQQQDQSSNQDLNQINEQSQQGSSTVTQGLYSAPSSVQKMNVQLEQLQQQNDLQLDQKQESLDIEKGQINNQIIDNTLVLSHQLDEIKEQQEQQQQVQQEQQVESQQDPETLDYLNQDNQNEEILEEEENQSQNQLADLQGSIVNQQEISDEIRQNVEQENQFQQQSQENDDLQAAEQQEKQLMA